MRSALIITAFTTTVIAGACGRSSSTTDGVGPMASGPAGTRGSTVPTDPQDRANNALVRSEALPEGWSINENSGRSLESTGSNDADCGAWYPVPAMLRVPHATSQEFGPTGKTPPPMSGVPESDGRQVVAVFPTEEEAARVITAFADSGNAHCFMKTEINTLGNNDSDRDGGVTTTIDIPYSDPGFQVDYRRTDLAVDGRADDNVAWTLSMTGSRAGSNAKDIFLGFVLIRSGRAVSFSSFFLNWPMSEKEATIVSRSGSRL